MNAPAPEVFHLARVNWQAFGSLSFKGTEDKIPTADRQRQMFFALVRELCVWAKNDKSDYHFRQLLFVLRHERGEATGREHLHFLIGGLPRMTRSLCFALMGRWERFGGGMARVTRYDHNRAGVAYVLDCLGQLGDRQAAQAYEMAKFSDPTDLVISYSVNRLLERYQGYSERRATSRHIRP